MVRITVGMATCGVSAGAAKVLETFRTLVGQVLGDLDIIVKHGDIPSGGAGFYELDPYQFPFAAHVQDGPQAGIVHNLTDLQVRMGLLNRIHPPFAHHLQDSLRLLSHHRSMVIRGQYPLYRFDLFIDREAAVINGVDLRGRPDIVLISGPILERGMSEGSMTPLEVLDRRVDGADLCGRSWQEEPKDVYGLILNTFKPIFCEGSKAKGRSPSEMFLD